MRTLFLASLLCAAIAPAQSILIRNASVIDGTGAAARVADVKIENGRITAIGSQLTGDQIIDATGKSLLPGLFDLHTHVAYSSVGGIQPDWGKNLKAYLRSGVTSLADFGTYAETFAPVRSLLQEGQWQGPKVFFASRFTSPGGHGAEGGRGDFFSQEVVSPGEARAGVARILPYRPGVIKVFTDGWRYGQAADMSSMDEETLRAIVEEAHKAGLAVLTHTVTLAKAKVAARAGVDAIMHGIQDVPVDDELIRLMLEHKTAYGPTASVYEPRAGYIQEPALQAVLTPEAWKSLQNRPMLAPPSALRIRKFDLLKANVAALYKAGIPVVNGTDAGVTGTHHGWATLREVKLLVACGLKPLEAIRASTSAAAKVVHAESERGTVAVGMVADLLLIDGHPDRNIADIDKISAVFQEGRTVDLAALTAAIHKNELSPIAAVPAVALLDDFESTDNRTRVDTLWVNATDNGQDHTRMLWQRVLRAPGNHALAIQAQMSEKPQPYGRMSLPLTRGGVAPVDAKSFTGIAFETRGEGAYALRLAARQEQPFVAPFQATPAWAEVKIPFSQLGVNWRGDDLTMLQFELKRRPGQHAWLELDNVRFYKE